MRSVLRLVIAAARKIGDRSLIRSGDITSIGRSPPCSEPWTGSSRTRTTSPLRGKRGVAASVVDCSVLGIVGRFPFLVYLAVEIPHLTTDRLDGLAESFSP